MAVEFAVGETHDAVSVEENFRETAATQRSDRPIEDDQVALYGRIGQEHARRVRVTAQLTGSPHKVRETRLAAKRHLLQQRSGYACVSIATDSCG